MSKLKRGFAGLLVAALTAVPALGGAALPALAHTEAELELADHGPASLMHYYFNVPDGLVTNEYAYKNPTRPDAVKSATWEVTSGSLFVKNKAGWSGIPDRVSPNATSTNGTDSAVFRLTTKRANFGNVAVSFKLRNEGLSSTTKTPPKDWDGVHIFLRYQSERSLYVASINRRDNTATIKKKVPTPPAGCPEPSNGGCYYDLAKVVSHSVPYGAWQSVRATVKNSAGGSVTINLYAGHTLLLTATDNGIGGSPITAPGKVGIRGDNCQFSFDNFAVWSY